MNSNIFNLYISSGYSIQKRELMDGYGINISIASILSMCMRSLSIDMNSLIYMYKQPYQMLCIALSRRGHSALNICIISMPSIYRHVCIYPAAAKLWLVQYEHHEFKTDETLMIVFIYCLKYDSCTAL